MFQLHKKLEHATCDLFWVPPDVEIYREPDILWTYSKRDLPNCNIVCWASPQVGAESEMVRRVLARHYDVHSTWLMLPSYQNAAMDLELEKNRYQLVSECESYVYAVDGWKTGSTGSSVVRSVETMADLLDYFSVLDDVYSSTKVRLKRDLEYYLAACTGEHRLVARYVAYENRNKIPISAAGVTISKTASFGLLWAGSTRKAYRGRGAYRALVDARMQFLKTRGVHGAGLYANIHTSAPIVAKMGFDRGAVMRDWSRKKNEMT